MPETLGARLRRSSLRLRHHSRAALFGSNATACRAGEAPECSAAASTSARVTDHTFRVFPSRLTPSATRLSLLLAATCKASTLEWRRTPKRRLCAFCHARRDAKSALRAATHASAPITLRLNEQDSKKTRQRVCIVSRRRRVLCRCACCLSFFVKRFNSACTWLQR